jgi:hypothetical protein
LYSDVVISKYLLLDNEKIGKDKTELEDGAIVIRMQFSSRPEGESLVQNSWVH